jgi:acetyl esterase/lipase
MVVWVKYMLVLLFLILGIAVYIGIRSPLVLINAITSSHSYTKFSNIPFGLDPRQALDVYRPKSGGDAPVVIFFYGGSWRSGSRTDYTFVAEALASMGIVVVVADYRLYPQVAYPIFLEDGARAVNWTINEIGRFGGSSRDIFLMGHSAGAYNASMIALDPRWLAKVGRKTTDIRGWIGLAGPYNFLPISNLDARPVFFYPNSPLDSQPIVHVDEDASPALLIAPLSDSLVDPIQNTASLAKKLKENRVNVEYLVFEKVNHVTLIGSFAWPLRGIAPTLQRVGAFVWSDGGRKKR